MIRIDALWLATQPLDMRCGTEAALSQVVQVFGVKGRRIFPSVVVQISPPG